MSLTDESLLTSPQISSAREQHSPVQVSELGTRIFWSALAIFALAASLIGIKRPMLIDESASIIISSYNLSGVFAHLRLDNSLPLYYVFLHGWTRIFGISEIAARLPSVLFYLLAVGVMWRASRDLSRNPRAGLYAAFFFAVSLQAIHLAQRVRMYSLLGFLAALSTWLFFRIAKSIQGSRSDWILYSVVNTLGAFTQVWFAFLLLGQFICACVFFRRSVLKLLATMSVSGMCVILLWGRSFLLQIHNGSTSWIQPLSLRALPGSLLEFYGGTKIGLGFLIAFVLLLLVSRAKPYPAARPEDERGKVALLLIFGVCIGAALLVSFWKPIYFPGRYTIVALPALALLLGWEFADAVPVRWMAAAACLVMLSLLVKQWSARQEMLENSEIYSSYDYSDKYAAEELAGRVRPGDEIIFTGLSRASIEYYFQRFHRDRDIVMVSYPAENAQHVGWDNQKVDDATLNTEAQGIVQSLATSKPARTIWVVAGTSPADRILFQRLRSSFTQREVLKLWGTFFTAVVAFDNSSLPAVTALEGRVR